MTKRDVHPASILLAVASLCMTAVLSPSWVFGKYPNLAMAMGRGDATAAQVGDASPGYLLLHVIAPPETVRWLQAIVAAATIAVLFELLRRRADPVAAGIGAGLLTVAQQWLIYSAVMEPDLLIGAAIVFTIALLEWAEPSVVRYGFAGLAMGTAVSLRPTALLFSALILAWLAWRRTAGRQVVAFTLATLLFSLLPSSLFKLSAHHDFRGTMSAGQVFHQSHRPESVGFGATFPSLLKVVEGQAISEGAHPPDFAHELYRELAHASDRSRTSAFDAEVYWFTRSASFFRLEPAAAIGQLVDKLVFFLAPPSAEYDIPAVRPLLHRPGLPLRWLTLLALGCLFVLAGTRTAEAVPWGLSWLASLAVGLLFYFHGRYAVGLVPSLVALIGLGLGKAWRERRRPWVLPVLLAPLLLLAIPSVRWADRMVERLDLIQTGRGSQANWQAARDAYIQEQAAVPDYLWPTSPHGVGIGPDDPEIARLAAQRAEAQFGTSSPVDATLAAALWAAAGQCDRALELADTAARSGFVWAMSDRSIDPALVASDCLLRQGRRVEAVERLEATNRAHPGRLDTLVRLVAAGDVGQRTDIERWERELDALHDPASVHFALATARRHWGDPQGSISDADWLIASWPRAAPFAEHERSLCFVDLGQPEEALAAWARALAVNAGLHEQSRLDPFVTALATTGPEGPRATELARRHWRKQGRR